MTSQVPFEILEERAAEQRLQLHNSVRQLRSSLRERLDIKRTARRHLLPASAMVGLLSLIVGWGFAGLFSRD